MSIFALASFGLGFHLEQWLRFILYNCNVPHFFYLDPPSSSSSPMNPACAFGQLSIKGKKYVKVTSLEVT